MVFWREGTHQPELITRLEITEQLVDLDATKDQVKDSPKPETDQPISRQYEATLLDHYGLQHYWTVSPATPAGVPHFPYAGPIAPVSGTPSPDDVAGSRLDEENYHLQSSKDLTSYSVYANDEKAGSISDILFDSTTWQVRFIEIESDGIMERDRYVLPVQVFKDFDPLESSAHVPVALQVIEDAPKSETLTDDDERELNAYYGIK
ncbi:PRC-barrel domain-containing protein [Geomicrobium sp. JCM 19039]|uniref:PRC-barrel domain-containing protein n=1 Tax=Geomicrobium sp. JCM 19039 TaxID=1460636 RepID=UPI00187BCD3D|nr:PRC-barrel domain-containing protein [Geomicrobium sp. JCM 19039]